MHQILIVDNYTATLHEYRRILGGAGHQVSAASSGHRAVTLASQRSFDVVLVDLSVRDMSTNELLSRLQEHVDLTQVVVTSSTAADVPAAIAGANVPHYVKKPLTASHLLNIVESAASRSGRSSSRRGRIDESAGRSDARRVLLMVQNCVLREGLTTVLKAEPGLDVVAGIDVNNDDLPQTIQNLAATVLLIDRGWGQLDTVCFVRELTNACPQAKTVVIDIDNSDEDLVDLIQAGVSGFLLKDATPGEVVRTVRSVLNGANALPRALTESVFSYIARRASHATHAEWIDLDRITPREHQIIGLMADGLSNKEIASRLNIATFTVKTHVHNILEKLALQTRVQVVRHFAQRDGNGVGQGPTRLRR